MKFFPKVKVCNKNRSPASLSKYESGDVNIAIDALVEICTALNVDIAEFLPATYSDPDNVDILKYKKHFQNQLYIYWYSGDAKKSLTFTPELTKELLITPEEIKELKRSNMLIIR